MQETHKRLLVSSSFKQREERCRDQSGCTGALFGSARAHDGSALCFIGVEDVTALWRTVLGIPLAAAARKGGQASEVVGCGAGHIHPEADVDGDGDTDAEEEVEGDSDGAVAQPSRRNELLHDSHLTHPSHKSAGRRPMACGGKRIKPTMHPNWPNTS